jgi:hypothetical protein
MSEPSSTGSQRAPGTDQQLVRQFIRRINQNAEKANDLAIDRARIDSDIGAWARSERRRSRLSLRCVAKKMQLSPPYLCDLELGRRTWRDELIQSFVSSIKEAK